MTSYKLVMVFRSGRKQEALFKSKKDAIDFINLHSNKKTLVKQLRLYERVVTTNEIEL